MAGDGSDLYDPHERLVRLRVLGEEMDVPENNTLLRCYQFLAPEAVPRGNFCWNGDCGNCRVTLRRDGLSRSCLSCQTVVREGDSLEEISPDVRMALRGVLGP